jgi:hypothetical protein
MYDRIIRRTSSGRSRNDCGKRRKNQLKLMNSM